MIEFQAWVDFVFNHSVGGEEEWYEGDYEKPTLTVAETAVLMTQTFTECGTALRDFSDGQIAIGIQFLTQPKKSDYIRAATSRELDIETRAAFLASIEYLYLDCFVPRCTSILPEEGMGASYLNTVCDQFWVNNDLPVLLASMGKKKRQR